tara:strand:+ start:2240 stop:2890 length:651 start_codon:yes stop_codon:yes gene_type:complete
MNKKPTYRTGESGFHGRMYEHLRGVPENNSKGPDLPNQQVELKSKKRGSGTKITLLTRAPMYDTHDKVCSWHNFRDMYKNETGRFYSTMKYGSPNNLGLYLMLSEDEDFLFIRHAKEKMPIARWEIDALLNGASEKLANLDFAVLDEGKICKEVSYKGFQVKKFKELLLAGDIVADVRMRGAFGGKPAKNRGTAFRAPESKLVKLYEESMERLTSA